MDLPDIEKELTAKDMFPDYHFPEDMEFSSTDNAVKYVAMHPEGKPLTVVKLKELIEVRKHKVDQPLERLQELWEFDIERMPDGPEKEQLMKLYDDQAMEIFATDLINMNTERGKEGDPNPYYRPEAWLAATGAQIRDFPFARKESMQKMFELVDQKKKELGIEKLYAADGKTEI